MCGKKITVFRESIWQNISLKQACKCHKDCVHGKDDSQNDEEMTVARKKKKKKPSCKKGEIKIAKDSLFTTTTRYNGKG